MVEVLATDEFVSWYSELEDDVADDVEVSVELLASRGVTLGFPHSSAIKGTDMALRELRVQSGGKPIRIFYAFDPKRNAVLILGGDKTGQDRFYETFIPRCESIWQEYLDENT